MSLDQTINLKTEQIIKLKPKILIKGDFADITIKMNLKICLELHKNNKSMGRIALRDGEETIAAGFVSEFFY
jgi:translation elongation factor EF-1alpha